MVLILARVFSPAPGAAARFRSPDLMRLLVSVARGYLVGTGDAMPQLIQHIDDIARAKGRDILFVRFNRLAELGAEVSIDDCQEREALIAFLEEQGIPWEPCAPSSTSGWICGYFGDIYVDVPYDTENALYQILQTRLEHPDGTLRDPRVRFLLLPLESCSGPREPMDWNDL